MTRWSPQQFRKQARDLEIAPELVERAIQSAERVIAVHSELPPIFTLRHFAFLSDTDYGSLRSIVVRSPAEPYRVFRVRKRASFPGEQRFRVIAVPNPTLMKAQRWIAQRILKKIAPHTASVAYSPGDTLVAAASPHCNARWIIKLDVRNFFESINETAVYRVFRSLGYGRLVALELTRLCTRLGHSTSYRRRPRFQNSRRRSSIYMYHQQRMGHLPQGAPTSPMLANLAVRLFDAKAQEIANLHGLVYTRYADDITLSSIDDLDRDRSATIIGKVYEAMGEFGLSPNITKTKIITPGARKVVLGLLVDGSEPRLTRSFRANMRQHLYYLNDKKVPPSKHAQARGFASVTGMKNHLFGLATFARQIDKTYGEQCLAALNAVVWPR